MKIFICLVSLLSSNFVVAQERWQQRVEYTMNVALNAQTHKLTGDQKLVYYNNSPDTLTKVYYHLFFNAFQPGSMMDVRSRTIADPDRRVMDRISKLAPDEIGYQHIQSLKQDGKAATFKVNGTLLEVTLPKPLLPKSKTIFEMTFEAQVPVQIRRSGRDNREGISYSMTQWYPKLAEYDFQGWHAYQYVAREFHGVWGDFDVKITLDPKFVIGGTGKLQNPEAIGHGYEKTGSAVKRPKGDLTWHFVAKDVIDFAWAADPDYTHDIQQVPNGPELHFFYQKNERTATTWKNMQPVAVRVFQFLSSTFGKYPFDTYSIIQGGDGGMEYPMCTLILGEGTQAGLNGVMAHEVAHSWYQMTLASNEALYAWMDEGFTDFASTEALNSITNQPNTHASSYASYFGLVSSGLQEPASQHSDHYTTNRAYSTAAYSMGAVFLQQLKYIIGDEAFYKGMKRYYNTWKMKHPEPNDFVRIMEKVSGQQLHWYYRYWIQTTKRIDYGVGSVTEVNGTTLVELQRVGEFPMPVDVVVTYRDGTKELFYIPLNEQLGAKPNEDKSIKRTELDAWPWVYPIYTVQVNRKTREILSIEIDPSQRLADVNRKNNQKELNEVKPFKDPTQ
ncbi:MAG: M1 family metallopeptidase [Cyclobacteriaceae bacterium]|nr:M1 family metallopeptidase [Cyclobacteriaceae bacterium]